MNHPEKLFSRAWAPGHATFFFAVPKRFENPLEMGSIGGGVNFDEGVLTEVTINSENIVNWNNSCIDGTVSKTAVELFNRENNSNIAFSIDHSSKLPIGFGLSTSGAGAIGTLLAINDLLGNPINKTRVYQLAHIADVKNHTGLGSVVGQITSGIELRLTQGGPGICKMKKYEADDKIIITFLGPLKTSDVLTSTDQMAVVTKAGINATKVAQSLKSNYVESFFRIGSEFTEQCGLITERVKKLKNELASLGETKAVMAQIGETLVIKPKNIEIVRKLIRDRKLNHCETRISSKEPFVIPYE